ncbi:Arginine deiminase [Diplonema papillatum]|nr:Arginine deiminase [Diplonema papillatum]
MNAQRVRASNQALALSRRFVHNTQPKLRVPFLRDTSPGTADSGQDVFVPPMTIEQRKAIDCVPRVQEHENDRAAFVLCHYPGQEIVMGSYHPCGALFECTISLTRSRECIAKLRAILESHEIPVRSLGEIMRMGHFSEDRERLKKLATSSLAYVVRPQDEPHLTGDEIRLTSDQYKQDVVGGLDVRDLVDVIVTQPTVFLAKSGNNTPLKSTGYRFEPLSNLIFTRDQMIVTAKGVILANLNSAQRAPEVQVVQFCLEKLGLEIIGHIEAPGTLEGGDFFPAGPDLCFIGMGIRTNDAAIKHMLKKDMFGTERVAVVADLFDRNQARMHLDCVANIASDKCFVVRESILGRFNPKRRLVTEWRKNAAGEYEISVEHIEFGEYLSANGYHIIGASEQMADDLGINFLNIGDGILICTDEAMAQSIEACPHFEGKCHVLDYREICKMYGAIHCTTQVFRHSRPQEERGPRTGVSPSYAPALAEFSKQIQFNPDEKAQTTGHVMLLAPTHFNQNVETLKDNEFMVQDKKYSKYTDIDVIDAACEEFQELYTALLREGVNIKLYHHEQYHGTPDACFPNNWFSTHAVGGGKSDLVLYPMAHPSRRRERRPDIVQFLEAHTESTLDLSEHEDENKFLEGTGSMVLDRVNGIAYAVMSSRTQAEPFNDFCKAMGYTPVCLRATDNMYHTNVMMSVGTSYAVVCFEHLADQENVSRAYKSLKQTGKKIIAISKEQCTNMCGNILELRSGKGEQFVAMSERAYKNYRPEQLYTLLQTVDHIVHPAYNTIETLAGGSVRCSVAELFF